MSPYTLAQKAKAVAAFVGSVVTALLGSQAADLEVGGHNVGYYLTAIAAVCTYVAAFKIPNAPTEDSAEVPEVGQH